MTAGEAPRFPGNVDCSPVAPWEARMHRAHEVAEGVFFLRTLIVNLFIVREGSSWILVDAGLGGYAPTIRAAAADCLGGEDPPSGVVLTHGHFDHVGSLPHLLEAWDVPVYAHKLERPYLTGRSSYPPPDPLAGGGAMTLLSRLFPRGPIDIGQHLQALEEGQPVPGAPSWRWIHTPGHTPGHVSLFRERDRVLIAGDAVTTVRQESALAVALQRRELHGPPAYYTQNWRAAAESVGRLAALEPEHLLAGHGEPLQGAEARDGLRRLGARFQREEIPAFGRYVAQPAVANEHGVVRLPPDPLPRILAGAAAAAAATWVLAAQARRRT